MVIHFWLTPENRVLIFCNKTDFHFQSRIYLSMQTGFIEFVFWSRLFSDRGEHELNSGCPVSRTSKKVGLVGICKNMDKMEQMLVHFTF